MTQVRVFGIGSPFGDDRIGWQVVSTLRQEKEIQSFIPNELLIENLDRPGINLLYMMKGAKVVFLVDAVKMDGVLGSIYRFENKEIETIKTSFSSHGFGLGETLQLGQLLNELPQKIVLFGIEIEKVSASFELSSNLKTSIDKLSKMVMQEILEIFNSKKN